MSVTGISASVLSAYYGAQTTLDAPTSAAAGTSSSSAATLVAPWQSASKAPTESALVKSVLGGQPFFSSASNKVPTTAGSNSQAYQSLFTLYQGVTALKGLAAAASASGVTAAQLASYETAFASGLKQLQTYVSTSGASDLKESAGIYAASETSSSGPEEETDTYTTQPLYTGAADGAVPAFQGDVAFTMTLTNPVSGASSTVDFNLADMGSTPRTMTNVVNYLNTQLKAAGVQTRFAVATTPGVPVTSTSNGKTTTLYTPPDSYALEIKGESNEVPTFTAADATPTVFVTAGLTTSATAGASGSSSSASTSSSTSAAASSSSSAELLAFDGSTSNASAFATTKLAAVAGSSLGTATGPDGSVYVLANVASGANGQAIQGSQDVALMKFDSAGNLVFSQDLGASVSASGYQITVSPDGSEVAVAGSASSGIAGAASGGAAGNGFVAAFSTSSGAQIFSAETPSLAGTTATSLAFGADDSLYVAGASSGTVKGATSLDGGHANYVQGFSASGASLFTAQFGSSALATTGLAVSGGALYLAGTQNGSGIIQSVDLSGGQPTLGPSRSLGPVSGPIAGIVVGPSGQLLVAGTSTNGAVSVGGVTTPYAGGSEGFVASLSPDLTSTAEDALTYVPGPSGFAVGGMTTADGQVYLVGQSTSATTAQGYAVAVNPASGAETWSTSFSGGGSAVAARSIAVAASGSSVLDALGLPDSIDYSPSSLLVGSTSLVAGDSFKIQAGNGPAVTVAISATDTLSTLANKIRQASGNTLTVSTTSVSGRTELKLTPANTTTSVSLIDGPSGSDALASLGLQPGTLSDRTTTSVTKTAAAFVGLGLNLTPSLNLGSPAAISAATTALNLASAKIQTAYQTLIAAPPSSSSTTSTAMSAQLKAQISNYQQALSWLEGNSSTASTSTTTGLASLLSSSSSSDSSSETSLL